MNSGIVIGVDPGVKCGFALVSMRDEVVCVDTWRDMNPFEILPNYDISGVRLAVIENAFIGINSRSALSVARKVGRWQEALESRGVRCLLPTASEWQSATLNISSRTPGAERKRLAIDLCRNLYGLRLDEHSADAVLLARWGTVEAQRRG